MRIWPSLDWVEILFNARFRLHVTDHDNFFLQNTKREIAIHFDPFGLDRPRSSQFISQFENKIRSFFQDCRVGKFGQTY